MRACHATVEIEEDECIVEIPLKCLVTVEMGKETNVRNSLSFLFSLQMNVLKRIVFHLLF